MRLETDLVIIEDVNANQLRGALDALGSEKNRRVILSSSDEVYLQAGQYDNGWVIEWRDGSEAAHWHAVAPQPNPLADRDEFARKWWEVLLGFNRRFISENAFPKETVIALFLAYLDGRDPTHSLSWSPGYCDR